MCHYTLHIQVFAKITLVPYSLYDIRLILEKYIVSMIILSLTQYQLVTVSSLTRYWGVLENEIDSWLNYW